MNHPRTLDDLPTPAFVVDLDVLDRNVTRMARRARELGVRLRPHIKTHKCVEIGRRQMEAGAAGVTVSTLHEARTFADHGFDDILWAFPVILGRLDQARALADRVRFGVVVDTIEAARALAAYGHAFEVHIKIDCGYHRAGMDPQASTLLDVARTVRDAPHLVLAGILSHSGHAYHGGSADEIATIAERERQVMTDCAARLRDAGIAVGEISVGSTPSMTHVRALDGVTEARPGNYAFFDYTQVALGSCTPGDCADRPGKRRILAARSGTLHRGRRCARAVQGSRPRRPARSDHGGTVPGLHHWRAAHRSPGRCREPGTRANRSRAPGRQPRSDRAQSFVSHSGPVRPRVRSERERRRRLLEDLARAGLSPGMRFKPQTEVTCDSS